MFLNQGRDQQALVKEMASMMFPESRIRKRDSLEYRFLMILGSPWPSVREVILVLGKVMPREFPVSKDLPIMRSFKT